MIFRGTAGAVSGPRVPYQIPGKDVNQPDERKNRKRRGRPEAPPFLRHAEE